MYILLFFFIIIINIIIIIIIINCIICIAAGLEPETFVDGQTLCIGC